MGFFTDETLQQVDDVALVLTSSLLLMVFLRRMRNMMQKAMHRATIHNLDGKTVGDFGSYVRLPVLQSCSLVCQKKIVDFLLLLYLMIYALETLNNLGFTLGS